MKENILVVCLALLIIACGAERDESVPQSENLEIQHYIMVPVDTIGIELGDSNYVFGLIGTVDFTPDGSLYPMAPTELRGADNGAIVGYQRVIRPRENEFGYALARWESSAEPVVSYLSSTGEFNPEDVMSSFMDGELEFAVSLNGTVYASLSSTDSYEVRGYTVDGEEILLIERPFSPVEKTEEEIRVETEEFERMIAQRGGGRHGSGGGPGGGGFTFEPEPLKISIEAIFVDSENRIWVRDGVHPEPWFDVFDTDGRELFTSSVDRELADLSGLTVVITPFGIAAYEENPLDYPRIYMLELDAPSLQSPEM